MTLGQRISAYRKTLGISQEELGARLGVSRQAVSKWETGAAAPDMENLLALAREFGVSVAELTQTPEPPPRNAPEAAESPASSSPPRRRGGWIALVIVLVLLVFMAGTLIVLGLRSTAGQVSQIPEPTHTEFYLTWQVPRLGHQEWYEYLALGQQDDLFPFGTSLTLTEPEMITTGEVPDQEYHDLVCGTLTLRCRTGTDGTAPVSIMLIETASRDYETPKGIGVGSTARQVREAYGASGDLIYCLPTCGPDTDIAYDDFYVYCPSDPSADKIGFGCNLIFLMTGDLVSGIRMEDASYPYYHVNNSDSFPVRDNEIDFSQKQEPKKTVEQQVYDALNTLILQKGLTAEELYADRQTIFHNLSNLDWWAFGDLGTTEHPEDTINMLLSWLREQVPYSDHEVFCLQMGVQSNLDGWLADSYAHLLFTAFSENPVAFAKGLACDSVEETMYQVVRLTAYDADLYPAELERALDTLDTALADGSFTDEERDWAELLRLYLVTPINDRYQLPDSPEELE